MKNLKIKSLTVICVVLVNVFICGCESSVESENSRDTSDNYSIVELDGCEYIECDYGIFDQRVYSLTHKGNCKFCAKRMNSKDLKHDKQKLIK